MDILSVAFTAFGAFGAGVTVGAIGFSPRLLTMTRRPESSPHDPAPMVYVVAGDPSSAVPSGIVTLAVPGTPGLPSITPPGMVPGPGAASDPREGQR